MEPSFVARRNESREFFFSLCPSLRCQFREFRLTSRPVCQKLPLTFAVITNLLLVLLLSKTEHVALKLSTYLYTVALIYSTILAGTEFSARIVRNKHSYHRVTHMPSPISSVRASSCLYNISEPTRHEW